MSIPRTDRLLADIGSRIAEQVAACGSPVCKVMVTHAGTSELECCDCSVGGDGYAVAVWDERTYPSQFPPLPVEPEAGSSAWVNIHEVHFTVATCWPDPHPVPEDEDPRHETALSLARIHDCVDDWLNSCSRNVDHLAAEPGLKVWNRGCRADRASWGGLECRGWEWTLLVW